MRKRVSELAHVSASDYIGVLSDLGSECIGAIKVVDPEMKRVKPAYIELTEEEIADIAGEGVIEASELVMKAHLSLAGASGKVGLYYEPKTSTWYIPVGEAPSTHIVKQSHVRLDGIVTNEQLCLLAAERLGIEVPQSFIVDTGGHKDSQILLATERFDRRLIDRNHVISGHYKPYRLHQEDFAQAMAIESAAKYETEDGHYMRDAFRLILDYSARPIEDQIRLWDIIVFDYLAGNTDGHLKNISLIYSKDLSARRLAPAYDLVSTSIYEMSTDNMAFSIGDDVSLPDISRDSFVRAAEDTGLSSTVLMKRFDKMADKFGNALHEAASDLAGKGFEKASELEERILETGGISRL